MKTKDRNVTNRVYENARRFIETIVLRQIEDTQTRLSKMIERATNYPRVLEEVIHLFPEFVKPVTRRTFAQILREYPAIERTIVLRRESIANELIGFLRRGIEHGCVAAHVDPRVVVEVL
jgi:hypothetical protein